VADVITASVPSWVEPFTGLTPRCFAKPVAEVRREQAADQQRGRPWSLSLEDRILLVTAYGRTDLTMRQLAPLFGISICNSGPLIGSVITDAEGVLREKNFQSPRNFHYCWILRDRSGDSLGCKNIWSGRRIRHSMDHLVGNYRIRSGRREPAQRLKTSGTGRQTWTLDAAGRLGSWATESDASGT
jgi:hypothetical protein